MSDPVPNSVESPRRPRRWLRIRLRSLLVSIAVLAIVFSLLTIGWRRYDRPRRIVDLVEGLGGETSNIRTVGPSWLNDLLRAWELGPIRSLTYIELRELPHVTDRELELICEARDLEQLIVYGTSVSESGFVVLGRLTKLQKLNLSGRSVTDDCFRCLSGTVSLTSIYTCDCAISDKGVRHLGKLSNLRYLALIESDVGDDGMPVLGTLQNLEYLELTGTKVTDQGLAPLAALSKLKQLDLIGTGVTNEGVEKLRQALPTTHIFGP